MNDVVLGLLAVAAGLVLCFWGHLLLRLIITIWGGFIGFAFGAGLVASITGDGFLGTTASWIAGLVGALLFAIIAHLYYAAAVFLAMGFIGFAVGTSLAAGFGIDSGWAVLAAGVVVGVLVVVIAIAADLPSIVLIVLSSMAGAAVATLGVMLLTNTIDAEDVSASIARDWWWYALYLALVAVGIVVQIRPGGNLRAPIRNNWRTR